MQLTEESFSSPLEFTEEMAAGMNLEALRQLSAILSRLIVSRNKTLVALVERHDELEHERSYREQLVEQLLQQVGQSRGLRTKRKGKR